MSTPNSRRVTCLDRHVLFVDCLDIALTASGHRCRVEVPTERSTAPGTLARVTGARPDVVVMNFDLSTAWDGMDLIEPLVDLGVDVVIVTESAETDRWGDALLLGAQVVLSKSTSLDTISAVIRQVSSGRSVLSGDQRLALMARYRQFSNEHQDLRVRLKRLTGRENEILVALMAGHTVSEIARASTVSEATVRTQVRSILTKLEVSSQLAAVSIAHKVTSTRPAA